MPSYKMGDTVSYSNTQWTVLAIRSLGLSKSVVLQKDNNRKAVFGSAELSKITKL
tara:strand:- start:76 stop:240 length:165 start_codon:yes stop_codon:yes gene_type:complete